MPRRPDAASSERTPPSEFPLVDTMTARAENLDEAASFPVVGVGASAGGLDAFSALFSALPADTGMAFVVLSHLDPACPSALSEILGRATTMRVADATDGAALVPGHVYVLPPGQDMTLDHDRLALRPRGDNPDPHPIDITMVRQVTGVDFTRYRPDTIRRRLLRRMIVTKAASAKDYVALLHRPPEEAHALRDDLLIDVTSFFRDPEVFEALSCAVLP